MSKKIIIILATVIQVIGVVIILWVAVYKSHPEILEPEPEPSEMPPLKFIYSFNVPGILQEAGNMEESASRYWWLNSGGTMVIENGIGRTNFGELGTLSKWHIRYALSTPTDTDQGYHPQNIFRLVTRNKWQNFSQQAEFRLQKYNLSKSENRNASNGVLFFLRYLDGDNLYYAGVRVDGTAVIKRKIGGVYYTLAQSAVYDGEYDRESNPNLLPLDQWFGMRSEIATRSDGSVQIVLYIDKELDGDWQKVTEAIDAPGISTATPIYEAGYAGVRGDFFDFEFKNFVLENIEENSTSIQ